MYNNSKIQNFCKIRILLSILTEFNIQNFLNWSVIIQIWSSNDWSLRELEQKYIFQKINKNLIKLDAYDGFFLDIIPNVPSATDVHSFIIAVNRTKMA